MTENYTGANYIAVTRGENYALFYAPNGVDIPVKLGELPGGQVRAIWYSPKTGERTQIGEFENKGEKIFSPLARGRDSDIVLCLEEV